MESRQFDQILRQAANPPVADATPPDLTAAVLSGLQGGRNPWREDWRRFLLCWVPLGLLLIVALALAVTLWPHGEHDQARSAAPLFPEQQR